MSIDTLQPTLFEGEQVPMVWPGSPNVHKSDPLTSHLAADSITASGLADSQAYVLNDLTLYGTSGAWAIEERAELTPFNWSPSRLRTALKELEESGRVRRLSGAGVTPRGRKCDMFEAVQS